MIAVGLEYPDKTTVEATNSQKFYLKKHQEELDMLQIGLNSVIPHENRTMDQQKSYKEIFPQED